jgi:hypothetical protein
MIDDQFPPEFIALLRNVTAKRPKTVIDHILEYGQITTVELKEKYGYNHPPRAIRDIREQGIPIETLKVTGTDGRKIGPWSSFGPGQGRVQLGEPGNAELHSASLGEGW